MARVCSVSTEDTLIFAGEEIRQFKFVLLKACSAVNLTRRVRNTYFSPCLCYDSKGALAEGVEQMFSVILYV